MEISKICEVCALHYILPYDKREHARRHERVLKAKEYFGAGFVLHCPKLEEVKQKSWYVVNDKDKSLDERVQAAIRILEAWFARSLDASEFSLKHPKFKEFTAALVWSAYDGLFPPDLRDALREKFGAAPKNVRVVGSYWTNIKKIEYTETITEAEARPVDKSCQVCKRGCKQVAQVIGCPRFDPISQPTKKGKSNRGD